MQRYSPALVDRLISAVESILPHLLQIGIVRHLLEVVLDFAHHLLCQKHDPILCPKVLKVGFYLYQQIADQVVFLCPTQ